MKKNIFALWCLLFCCSIPAAEYTIDLNLNDLHLKKYEFTPVVSENERITFSVDGAIRSYFVYVPKRSSPTMPLLIALHGAGRTGSSMIHTWRRSADKHGFMIVAPNGDNRNWNVGSEDYVFIKSAVNDAAKLAGITVSKIYLFGHSNGAKKAIVLAATHTEEFTAVAVHAGTLPAFNMPSLGQSRQQKPPLAIFLGDRDHIFSITSARDTVRWLSASGFPASLYILEQHSHWYYEDFARINESIWAFMSKR